MLKQFSTNQDQCLHQDDRLEKVLISFSNVNLDRLAVQFDWALFISLRMRRVRVVVTTLRLVDSPRQISRRLAFWISAMNLFPPNRLKNQETRFVRWTFDSMPKVGAVLQVGREPNGRKKKQTDARISSWSCRSDWSGPIYYDGIVVLDILSAPPTTWPLIGRVSDGLVETSKGSSPLLVCP